MLSCCDWLSKLAISSVCWCVDEGSVKGEEEDGPKEELDTDDREMFDGSGGLSVSYMNI